MSGTRIRHQLETERHAYTACQWKPTRVHRGGSDRVPPLLLGALPSTLTRRCPFSFAGAVEGCVAEVKCYKISDVQLLQTSYLPLILNSHSSHNSHSQFTFHHDCSVPSITSPSHHSSSCAHA